MEEKSNRWKEFHQKWGILKDEYLWRGTIGPTEDYLEKSTFKYIGDFAKLCKEYSDLVK